VYVLRNSEAQLESGFAVSIISKAAMNINDKVLKINDLQNLQ
jgi:hypothetical protein